MGRGVVDSIEEILPPPDRGAGPLLVLADPDTWDAAGSRVSRLLRGAGFAVREVITRAAPHADDHEVERLRPTLGEGPSRIVAVGAGTLGDLGKTLAQEAGIPLMTVGTAASMNGYASSIAALTVRGLKVTRPVAPPDLLILDTEVLAAAPVRLTRAGFGDLCSKPVSGADWRLSQRLFGETICPTALSMVDDAVASARGLAAEIGRGERDSVAILAEALVLSGLSMAFAGASSPASGGEHLISHFLDMSAEQRGRDPRLHGEQVAVGTRASLALYRRARAAGPPSAGDPSPDEEMDSAVERLGRHLSGDARESVRVEAREKRRREPGRAARREQLRASWSAVWSALDDQLASGEGLEDDLVRAGVPTTFGAIGVGIDSARETLLAARLIRNRYTVLDLVADLGHLEAWAGEVAEALG